MDNNYQNAVSQTRESLSVRSEFLRKTYLNLAIAFFVFIGLEAMLMNYKPAVDLAYSMVSGSYSWLIVLGAFMLVSWIANSWAHTSDSIGMQYAGLYLYVLAESIICLPLLLLADIVAPDAIPQAAILTAALAGGITLYAFRSGKNFSYMGSFLCMASFVALGIIVCAIIFGFELGLWFSAAMVVFAGLVVLYQTSVIIHEFDNRRYVAAALGLFAAIVLMFWYILRIFISQRD